MRVKYHNWKRRGTARYVREKKLADGRVGYFFDLPTKFRDPARQPPCPVGNEPLGTDCEAAIRRAKEVLLPALDAWLRGDNPTTESAPDVARYGTLDWVFAEYRKNRRGGYHKLSSRQKRNHENGYRLVANRRLDEGRGQRIGSLSVERIDTDFVDTLYENLLVVRDEKGNVIGERRTTVNHAMKSWRRAWKIATRANPKKMPVTNPFAAMGLKSSDRETPTATFEELQTFRKQAVKMGFCSLATAALHAWEFLQRETDIFGTFDVKHYRPKNHPNAVRVLHEKTREENWMPLFDEQGAPLYPELMAELDAIKRDRIGGLMFCRDKDQRPWPTWPKPDEEPDLIDLTHMSRTVKKIIEAAGLRHELTFTSFRHGGFTEGADADLTDAELRAQGRHKSKVLPRYAKRTMKQVAVGQQKRRASRTNGGQSSE
jgi:hypothetical protein